MSDSSAQPPQVPRAVLSIEYASPQSSWRAVDGVCALLGIYALAGLPGDVLIGINTVIYMVKLPAIYGGRLGQVGELIGNLGAIASYALMLASCVTLYRGDHAKDRLAFSACLVMAAVYALRTVLILKQQLATAGTSFSYPVWRYWTMSLQAAYALLFSASQLGAALLIKTLAQRAELFH